MVTVTALTPGGACDAVHSTRRLLLRLVALTELHGASPMRTIGVSLASEVDGFSISRVTVLPAVPTAGVMDCSFGAAAWVNVGKEAPCSA